MPAKSLELADAVVVSLNAGRFSRAFTARRVYDPLFELQDLRTVKLLVVPAGETDEVESRSSLEERFAIDVALLIGTETPGEHAGQATLDAWMQVADEIKVHLRDTGELAGCAWVACQRQPLWDPERLRTIGVMLAVQTHTYRRSRF